jgi:hypothetical protein
MTGASVPFHAPKKRAKVNSGQEKVPKVTVIEFD